MLKRGHNVKRCDSTRVQTVKPDFVYCKIKSLKDCCKLV